MLTKICKNKKTQGILAILLIITMTLANILFLGKNLISYAFETDLEAQNENTQSNNVKFDAYFSDNGGRNVHSAIFDATNSAIINLHLAVKDAGYLKEAYIDFRDEQNSNDTNYEIVSDLGETTLVQNVNKELKTISLNFVDYGTDAVIQIPVKTEISELMNVNKLNQGTKVTLRGIYVDRLGAEIEISKTINLNLGWTLETELNLEQSVEKYIPYTNGEQSGVLLQMQVKAKQNREDITLPIKGTEIKIDVPQLKNILPESAIVIADQTLATNGEKKEFSENNWSYNKEEGKISINTEMYQENENVWAGVGTDTYLITYIYPDATIEEETTITSNIEAKMEMFSAGGVIEKTATLSEDISLNKEIGSLVTYSVIADQKEMSKGRMYANCGSDAKNYDTAYGLTIKANVSNYETVEKLTFEIPTDTFLKEEKEYSIPNTYSKKISINKAKMQKVLGEDGFVKIFDGTGTYIINAQTEDTDGNYIIDLDENISNIIVETSAPITNEIFKLDVRKIISKDLAYSKTQLQEFDTLKINVYANKDIVSDTITLTETSTNAKLEMSKVDLVSSTENTDVNFKIMLNNSSEASDLYKNAVFEIALPKFVEDIYGMANILYTNGLAIDKIEKVNTENGIVLKITTTGAENMFSDGVLTNGAVITIDATLKIGEVLEDVTDKVIFTYTNENAVAYANEGREEIDVNFIARQKQETLTETPDVVTNPDIVTEPEVETPDLDAKATLEASTKLMYQDEEVSPTASVRENQEIKYVTTIKNTSVVDANNVKLVTNIPNGKITYITIKTLDADGKELSSDSRKTNGDNVTTFTARWASLPAGGSGVFEYTVMVDEIEEIGNNEKVVKVKNEAGITYVKINEDNSITPITYEEYLSYIKIRNTLTITADNLEEINEELVSAVSESLLNIEFFTDDSSIKYRNSEIIPMNIHIENVSENTINNLVLTYVVPEGLEYLPKEGEQNIVYDANTKTITINIDKIDPNSKARNVIEVKVSIPNEKGNIEAINKAKVTADGIGDYYSNELKLNLASPVFEIELSSSIANGSYVKEGQAIEINGIAKNIEGSDSDSTKVSVTIPERFKMQEATYILSNGKTGRLVYGAENEYYFIAPLRAGESVNFKIIGTAKVKKRIR